MVARQFAPLSERQVAVLRWVADGCRDGVWQDFSYKRTAYALADRGLVRVDRRRGGWRASITEDGHYYLQQGAYRPAEAAGPPLPAAHATGAPTVSGSAARAPLVTPQSPLAELTAASGLLTIPDPARLVRAAYRSAISRAVTEGLVPEGEELRHTGRDRGDLVIRLVRLEEEPRRPEPPAAIPVPADLRDCHPTVAALRDTPPLLLVSDEVRDRTLRIAQAVAAECERRDYGIGLRRSGEPSFRVSIGQDDFAFTLAEESEKREVTDQEKLAAAKYSWQRVPSVIRRVPSGRLVLRLEDGYRSVAWADRQRWTLEQKLPAMFQMITGRASAQAQQRWQEEDERRQRRQAWEQAIPRAQQAYIENLNRKRLRKQATRSAEAATIRAYCARLESLASQYDGTPDADPILAWAAWARHEADRIDPANHPDRLTYVTPQKVRESEFEKYMPPGLSAWHPPG